MEKFNQWCSKMDTNLEKYITSIKSFDFIEFICITFPIFSSVFNIKKTPNSYNNFVYDTKYSKPIYIKSEKLLNFYNAIHERSLSGVPLERIQLSIKREICDEIFRSDLFEWDITETAMGTRVAARISINNFSENK
jgi:hypothetical protein